MRDELKEFIDKPVDIDRLVRKLTFDINDLESAALSQPKLRLEVGRLKAQAALNVSNSKRRLARVVGKKSLKIRHRGEKVTESAIKNSLSLDSKVQVLQKKVERAEAYYEVVSQFVESYKERTMMIAVLTKLKASEISSHLSSVKGDEALDAMRKKARRVREQFDMVGDEDE